MTFFSLTLSVVWKQLQSGLQSSTELCAYLSASQGLQDIYLKRCKSRAAKIIKDSNHPDNRLFILLPSGKRFRSMMAKTERLRRSFFPPKLKLSLITFTRLNLIINQYYWSNYSPPSILLLCVYTRYNLFAHPCLYYY